MADVKGFQADAKELEILYVEDNDALRVNAAKLLGKFFKDVHTASDGAEGFALFRTFRPRIVITDIKMPNLTGTELSRKIRRLDSKTKIIFMSAFDEKEYLYEAIEVGAFRYLKKPVNLNNLIDILHLAVKEIKREADEEIFKEQVQNVFNYQSAMIVMYREREPILANQSFLDFFAAESMVDFCDKVHDLGSLFLEHDGFLYDREGVEWFSEITIYSEKLFHVKMKDAEDTVRHFLLKVQKIPHQEGVLMLSFDDVTELNLLKLFDAKQLLADVAEQDTTAIYKLLHAIQRNAGSVNLYNYYKGLSITHPAVISEIKEETVVFKTNFMQQKAIQYEQKMLIVSDALPYTLESSGIVKISFESQAVHAKKMRFVKTSPIVRKTIRLVPEEEHTVSLFLKNSKYPGEVRIEDISVDSVRLSLSALPAGLEVESEVIIDMVLMADRKPLIINTAATLLKKIENKYDFSLVFMFHYKTGQKTEMIQYISKRQMAIIREFKGLQNG
jgi:YesN/AraC family two-component response regulator